MKTTISLLLSLFALTASAHEDSVASLTAALAEAASPSDRIEVLDRASDFAAEAEESDATAATGLVAEAMWEEEHAVRIHAVRLLANGFAPELVQEKLLARCEDAGPEEATLIQQVQSVVERSMEIYAEIMDSLQAGKDSSRSPKADTAALKAESKKLEERSKALNMQLQQHRDLRSELTRTLGSYRGMRVVRALRLLLNERPDERSDPILDGLLDQATPQALEAVVGCVEVSEQRIADLERKRKDAKNQKPRELKSTRYTKKEWKDLEKERILRSVDAATAEIEKAEAWGESLGGRLRRFAKAYELSVPPRKMRPATAWETWASEASEALRVSSETTAGSTD